MNDGSVVSGKLISDTERMVIQSGSMGEIRLEKSNIDQ